MLKHLFISVTILLSAILSASAISIGEIGFFGDVTTDAAPNWPHFITLALDDEADSAEEQTLSISVTSLPDEGANYRIVKTVRNGNFYFAPAQALVEGENNLITVGSVDFARVVKIQFSSSEIEYDSLVVNGSELSLDTSGVSVSPDNSYLFEEADNDDWPLVTTLTTISDGLSSQGEQTFEMYVTSLPTQVANLRVYKTTSDGSDYFGEPQQIKLGPNTVTVTDVTFDRTVKIQLSSSAEDIQFNALSVNSSQLYPGPPVISLNGASSITLTVGDAYEDLGATAVDAVGNPVEVTTDATSVDTNTAGTYTVRYSVDTAGSPIIITRTVVVEDSVRDTLPPVITLSGDSSITLTVGDAYEELGASATDATDGTVDVINSGEVNTSSIGAYTITYTATDAAGNSASATRTVTIEEADSDGDGVANSIDVHPGFDDTGLSTYLETWLTENSYVSTSAIEDFRAGSTSVAVSGGTATINLEMEQSDDLQAWTPTGESATVNVTVSEGTRFYRIKLAD